jgi:hypothetical protein
MDVSGLTLKLIFILIPGALASMIFEKLTIHRPWNSFKFIAHSILFGVLSYLVTGWSISLISPFFNFHLAQLMLWRDLTSKNIPFDEIGKATFTAIVIGFLSSALDSYKIINRFAAWLKITNKYGDINLYSHFLNSPNIGAVYFRDLKSKLTYHGFVEFFSETDEIKEIVLINVIVYNSEIESDKNTVELYRLNAVYLSRPKDEVLIEIPIKIQENEPENSTTT